VKTKGEVEVHMAVNDLAGVIALVQFGALEIHGWGARKDNVLIGKSIERIDGFEKVSGKAKYTADMNTPGTLYAKLLTCQHAHAKLNAIDVSEAPVNWCPALGTVLANEEVIDGKSEVGGHPVERRPMRQWMLRITAFADRLIDELDGLDWPESIKLLQRNWIGRSVGAEVDFEIDLSPAPGTPTTPSPGTPREGRGEAPCTTSPLTLRSPRTRGEGVIAPSACDRRRALS